MHVTKDIFQMNDDDTYIFPSDHADHEYEPLLDSIKGTLKSLTILAIYNVDIVKGRNFPGLAIEYMLAIRYDAKNALPRNHTREDWANECIILTLSQLHFARSIIYAEPTNRSRDELNGQFVDFLLFLSYVSDILFKYWEMKDGEMLKSEDEFFKKYSERLTLHLERHVKFFSSLNKQSNSVLGINTGDNPV